MKSAYEALRGIGEALKNYWALCSVPVGVTHGISEARVVTTEFSSGWWSHP